MSKTNLFLSSMIKYLQKFCCPGCYPDVTFLAMDNNLTDFLSTETSVQKKSEIKMRWFIVPHFVSESDFETEKKMLIYLPNVLFYLGVETKKELATSTEGNNLLQNFLREMLKGETVHK